jgi:hypothetical protein
LKDTEMSPYNRMFVHMITVCGNVMGDSPQDYSQNLTYLIENERDNPGALLKALLCTSDLTAAAEHLIRRLESPDKRSNALLWLQYRKRDWEDEETFRAHSIADDLSPGHIIWHRAMELRDRRDIKETVNQVGRIEVVPMHWSTWYR